MKVYLLGKSALAILTVLGLALSASGQLSDPLSEGLTITETTTSSGAMGGGGRSSTAMVYFSGKAIKRVETDGRDTIYRLDEGKLIDIDNNKKTYSEMTFQQMQEMMDKAVEDNPQAMEAMRKMMGNVDMKMTVTKEGPGETIAGYATEKYLVTGPMELEIWAAPELKPPAEYFESMKMRIPRNPVFDMRQIFDAYKQIDGWPMKSIMKMNLMGMSMSSTTEVTSVKKGSIPSGTFDIPQGYRRVANREP